MKTRRLTLRGGAMIRRFVWFVRVWWIQRAESRAFYRAHGPVVKTEPNNGREQ